GVVSDITVSAITSNSATISWTAGFANIGTYDIYISTSAVTDFTGITPTESNISGTSYDATSLPANTLHYVYVRAACANDEFSPWVSAGTFTTLCGAFSLTFTEGFNNSTMPNCWTQQYVSGTSNIAFATSGSNPTASPSEGSRMVYWASYNSTHPSGSATRLVSPLLNIQGMSSIDVEFDWRTNTEYNYPNEGLQVQYSIDGGNNWVDAGDFLIAYSSPVRWEPILKTISGLDEYDQVQIGFKFVSGYGANCFMDNLKVYETTNCIRPTSVTASAITSNSANVSWTAGGTEAVWNIIISETAVTNFTSEDIDVPNHGSTTYPATNLEPNTTYYVYVQAVCGAGEESEWASAGTFTTLCEAFSIPFIENFETTSTTLNCWTVIDNNNDGDYWKIQTSSSYVHSGSQSYQLYTDFNNGANDDYLISPPLELTGNEELSFYYRARSSGEPNDFRVVLSTTGIDPSDFTQVIMPLREISNTSFMEEVIDLSAYSGTVYIAFHVPSGGLDGYYIYIDDVAVKTIPTCLKPSGVIISNILSNSADISWTAGGSETAWDIIISETAITDFGTATITAEGITTNPYPATSLSSNTTHYVYVRAVCGAGDESEWSNVGTFTTPCSSYPIPFSEDFTATTFPPQCWERKDLLYTPGAVMHTSDMTNVTGYWNRTSTESNYGAYINIYGTGRKHWFITPPLDFGNTGNIALSFDVKLGNNSDGTGAPDRGSDDKFIVLISVDGGISWDPANAYVWSSAGDADFAYSSLNQNYQNIYLPLTGITGDVRIAFYGESTVSNADDYLFIDNIEVDLIPTCPSPTSVTASAITINSAEISWTAGGTETAWDIIISETAIADLGTAAITAEGITTNPYPATSLNSNTTYYVYVRAVCDVDDLSYWSDEYSFITSQVPATLPYLHDFAAGNAENDNWILANGTQTNKWYIGSTTSGSNTVSDGLYISNDNGASNTYSTGFASYTYAYRRISIEQAGTLSVQFDWRAVGESNWDLLRAFLVPESLVSNLTAGSANGMSGNTNTTPANWIDLTNGKLNLQSSTQHLSSEITINTAGIYYLVFFWKNDGGGGTQPPAYVDNIEISVLACADPMNLAVSAITDNSAIISWNEGHLSAWNIIVSPTAITNFDGQTLTAANHTSPTYSASELNENTLYYVYVQGICEGDAVTGWSNTTFTTEMSCGVVRDITATDITDNSATISWTAGFANTGTYDIYISTSAVTDFTGITPTESNISGTSYDATSLPENTLHYVYVRAACANDEFSPWTGSSFRTICTTFALPFFEGFETNSETL
ncbi:choice-of-anchor J domain-containing protein, partial [Bacteroidales bacterium OttesenSCG-928-I21]|nr:choice-of-anchor J domain-containing protein [Bacteroidales bacterium OttesenSCG-928-I21]